MTSAADRDKFIMEVATNWFLLGGNTKSAEEYLSGILEKLQHDLLSSGMDQEAVSAELKSFLRLISDTAQGILRRRFGTLS